MTKTSEPSSYNSKDLDVLEGVEAIQRRPGMYIGGVGDEAVAVCAREPIDNIVDEHMNGNGDRGRLEVSPSKGTMAAEDWARGIPVDPHPKFPGLSGLEVVLTKAHSGGKFSVGGDRISSGMHGTGLKAVNAMSSTLLATVWRGGLVHELKFRSGRPEGALASRPIQPRKAASRTGTRIEFALDPARFPDATSTVVSRATAQRLLQERAYLNPGLTLELDYEGYPLQTFHEPEGISAYARLLAGGEALFPKVAYFDNGAAPPGIRVRVALAWKAGPAQELLAFCNSVNQPELGTHATGLRMALPAAVKSYVAANRLIPAKEQDLAIEPRDCFEGVQAIVAIQHVDPVLAGQAKGKLTNGDAQGAVQRLINERLPQWLEENPKEARLIGQKAVVAARAREAAARAREGVRKIESVGISRVGKLADCSSRDPALTELLIVEGESASGTVKDGRDRRTQAVYPLRGKPQNSWRLDPGRTMANVELSDLAVAIGTGLLEPGAPLAGLRYGKIIILSDADQDGQHIQALLLGHFYRHMRPLIENGHVYVGQPPLYRVGSGKGRYQYLKGDPELAEYYRSRAARAGVRLLDGQGRELPKATAALAGSAFSLIQAAKALAGNGSPAELAHASRFCSEGCSPQELASALADARAEEGAEAVSLSGTVVSGLFAGKFFVTVVDEEFLAAAVSVGVAIAKILGGEGELSQVRTIEDRAAGRRPYDAWAAAQAFDAEARRGSAIDRMKGLGSMSALEIAETTLDASRRRLIRVRVEDFDEAGRILNSILSSEGRYVEARQELLARYALAGEELDA